MRRDRVRDLLAAVAGGRIDVESALRQLDEAPVEDLGIASLDDHRALRQGFPEVVYGEAKSPEQVRTICTHLAGKGDGFLVTRAGAEVRACSPRSGPEPR